MCLESFGGSYRLSLCLPAYARACLRARVRACLRVSLRACLRACVPACVPAYVLTCLRACLRAHVPACLPTCLRACLRVYVRACMLACPISRGCLVGPSLCLSVFFVCPFARLSIYVFVAQTNFMAKTTRRKTVV